MLTGAQPSLTGVSPTSAQQGTTLTVVLTGQNTNFAQGTTTAGFGAGITVNSVTVSSSTSATANITDQPHCLHGRTHGHGHDRNRDRHQCLCGDGRAGHSDGARTEQRAAGSVEPEHHGHGPGHALRPGRDHRFLRRRYHVNTVTVTSATSATVNVTLAGFRDGRAANRDADDRRRERVRSSVASTSSPARRD